VTRASSLALRLHVIRLAGEDDYHGWRAAARRLASAGVPPEAVVWQVGDTAADLFGDAEAALPPQAAGELRVPRAFLALAETALLHSDHERFAVLYALLLRVGQSPQLLGDHADPMVRRAELLAKAVRRDLHKMHAFVRFREVAEPDGAPHFIAWFEPDHHIVRAAAGFFVRRFAQMHWSILTPEVSLHWDGEALREAAGADRSQAPDEDALEEMWKAYYASTFNPARLKVGAMVKEMPRRYWKNLPEAQLIAPLIAGAQAREAAMIATAQAPGTGSARLAGLAAEAQGCRRCPLWEGATQCVFGEGPADARLMVVGEQPGDEEDRAGRPFVGPAGQLLDRALGEAGIERKAVYVTNAVKHFKFVLRGKRRLHQSPSTGEIDACRWWLGQEIALLRPQAILMLGASAVRGVTGKSQTVGKLRGNPLTIGNGAALASWHPSYVLRLPDQAAKERVYAELVADLRAAAEVAG
jgi:uracil-DNA glycosylase